ncbi:extracellular mutant protein 11-domain-containing protein [Paraphoma chrysanthemicola]|uniref:Extracellular mutant protein 11-domain-containing protein n=1 Tax=Paraphoma chrysanthemicola TaxID=798071 RepID=A0A8K0VSV1_9PLEO|nr:extracellular mutant protein 11-domain-containing protein [Paraphoma chrysanthemicola]
MSSISKFVQQRNGAGSPQNAVDAQRIDPARQARAANAKVSMKRRPASQNPQQVQPPSAIPTRGVGKLQDSAAFIQHEPQRQHSGPGFKRDPYDTDAESIDTTVNESVIQAEDFQMKNAQYSKVVDDYVVFDQGEGESEEDNEEFRGNVKANHHLTQQDLNHLHSMKMQNLPPIDAVAFLQDAHLKGLPTIEGDSYPPTTNGDPSEGEGVQDSPPSEDIDEDIMSSSSKRADADGETSYVLPPKGRGYLEGTGPMPGHPVDYIFKQSATLRGQQRVISYQDQKPLHGHRGSIAPMHPGQPVPRSLRDRKKGQAKPGEPQWNQDQQSLFDQSHRHVEMTRSRPTHAAPYPPNSLDVHAQAKRPVPVGDQVVPIIQCKPSLPHQFEPVGLHPHLDYDLSILHTMSYEELKSESFDTNPRAEPLSFPEEKLQKPLAERLLHVQGNYESAAQAHFFQSLPTRDWEEAGDWFLDQFSNIIRRTKEARQKKRKLAQDFEVEVEKRHKHVSKKQHQVESAMNKMKAQGEGLVPKSPRSKKARSDT